MILVTTPLNLSSSKNGVLRLISRTEGDLQDNEILAKYHWNDRDKLFKDYDYTLNLYEKYLVKITASMNLIHETKNSIEFWRIIIGPWLYYFISISFDRYEMLKAAAESYDIEFTELPKYDKKDWLPNDYIDFNENFYSDEWNYFLFSEIIKHTKIVKTKKSTYELSRKNIRSKNKRFSFFKSLMFFLTKITRNFYKKVVFVEVDIPQKNLYKILYKLNSSSFSYYKRIKPKKYPINHDLRSNFFSEKEDENPFENLLSKLIPENIPISYIEGLKEIEEKSKKIFPTKTELIITSNAYFSNEHFKVWAANQKKQNSQLWVMVHGGHHGTALFNGPGKLTEDLASRFYGWGWAKHNLPSPKLSILRQQKITKPENNILFIPYSVSHYSNHIDSSPISSSFNDCLKMHNSFFKEVNTHNLSDKILIRLKSDMVLRNLENEYKLNSGIKNFIYSSDESLSESISKSELVIVAYDSTVFLESLVLNKPTCLFIRKNYWEMSKKSEKFFNDFNDCGILHYNETSLINHIANVKDDYSEWWNSDSVQLSVKRFLKNYGLNSDSWEEDWYNEIDSYFKLSIKK